MSRTPSQSVCCRASARNRCVVGNTSLAGALLALVDRTTLVEMETLRAQMEVIELNLAADFEDRYIEHLMLP